VYLLQKQIHDLKVTAYTHKKVPFYNIFSEIAGNTATDYLLFYSILFIFAVAI